jgi:hypothetical protein
VSGSGDYASETEINFCPFAVRTRHGCRIIIRARNARASALVDYLYRLRVADRQTRSGKLFSPRPVGQRGEQHLDHSDQATSFDTCAKHDPKFVQSAPPAIKPRLLMIIAGPIVGILLGVVAGLFAWIGSKIIRRHA